MTADPALLSFRRLEPGDLPLLHRWLNTPHVLEWWDNPGPSPEKVEADYLPTMQEGSTTRCYLILHGGVPIGFIQEYLIDDHPEYGRCVQVEAGAAGVDLLIGEAAFVHRGLGAPILRRALDEIVFARPDVTCCIIGPAVTNRVAIRAYEKAGFTYLKTVQVPDEEEPEYLMRISR